MFESGGTILAIAGDCWWRGQSRAADVADEVMELYRRRGEAVLEAMRGSFAVALYDQDRTRGLIAVDRIGTLPVYFANAGSDLLASTKLAAVASHPGVNAGMNEQALYDFLHFHMIPGPETVFANVFRLLPGQCLRFEGGRFHTSIYWNAHYRERHSLDWRESKDRFREAVLAAVRRCVSSDDTGAFLSGGTDSSTVVGMMSRMGEKPPQAFSIGFDAEGYDETAFARVAAAHFGARHHTYNVTPNDVADAVPKIASAYDQPFGNASVVPTYYCARMARERGVKRLLGGDGGDELFGGNTRYAKQLLFSAYERLPRSLRRWGVEPLAAILPPVSVARKLKNYVAQSRLPMPDRMESYNLLHRLGPRNILSPDLLAAVDTNRPLELIRDTYFSADADSVVNRMLARDLRFTLADDDLVKVRGACELAGVEVEFPFLDEEVVNLSLELPSSWKVRRNALRPFFKDALSDFLPPEVIGKSKHGFGLPFGVWLTSERPLIELAGDSLSSLRGRGIVRQEFIDRLLSQHLREHAGYYGTMVWILMMLEQWLQADGHASSMPSSVLYG